MKLKGRRFQALGVITEEAASGHHDKVVENYIRVLAQSGSAPGLGPGGRRFDPYIPD